MTIRIRNNQRVEGIRKTEQGSWAVVLSEPTPCGSHSQRTLVLGAEYTGVGAKAQAIKAAGTNKVITGPASKVLA
jgi:hypothetical protein